MKPRQTGRIIGGIILCMTVTLCGCRPTPFEIERTEGNRLLQEGRYPAARNHFLTAHDMVPESADNLCDLGRCHLEIARGYLQRDDRRSAIREVDEAVDYFRRAVQSYPGYENALTGLNQAQEMRGEFSEALETTKWASQVVGPSARHQLLLANEYEQRGDADNALLAYKQAVAMEPGNPRPHYELGLFYAKLNRRQEAIEHLDQAYRLDPTQTIVADELKRLGAKVPEMASPDDPE